MFFFYNNWKSSNIELKVYVVLLIENNKACFAAVVEKTPIL